MAKESVLAMGDLYAQHARLDGSLHHTDSSVLHEHVHPTGLAMFGERAWAIHQADIYWENNAAVWVKAQTADASNHIVLTIGEPDNGGEIHTQLRRGDIIRSGLALGFHFTTSGTSVLADHQPQIHRPPTPIPYAGDAISVYMEAESDEAALLASLVHVVLHYTFIPVDDKLWREIAQMTALRKA